MMCCGIVVTGTYVYVRYRWGIKPIANHLVAVLKPKKNPTRQ